MRTVASEKEIQSAILEYLNLQRNCVAWRFNRGAMAGEYKGKRRFTVFGPPGCSDILGVLNGRFLAIEVKRPGNEPTVDQQAFLDSVSHAGGIAAVAHSLDELIEKVFGK